MTNPPKHTVVAGAGSGGMTMALLLAMTGRSVVMIDIQPQIGGYMRRFSRDGIYFDTGFHFTGGFENILTQMLQVMNIDDVVREAPFRSKLYLAESSRHLFLPETGVDDLAEYLAQEYPSDRDGIMRYYECEKAVIANTPMFDLRDDNFQEKLQLSNYDTTTLAELFSELKVSRETATALGSAALCHGTPPCESSVTHHCRVSYGLGNHISRTERGGDSFIDAFHREAQKYGIRILTDTRIAKLDKLDSSGNCSRVLLSNGEHIETDEVYFSFHPYSILELMPEETLTTSFLRRVHRMEDSCSFFSIFGVLDNDLPFGAELTSYLSVNNLDDILLPGRPGTGTGIVLADEPDVNGNMRKTLTAFRTMYADDTLKWKKLSSRKNNREYQEFKERTTESVIAEVYRAYPEFKGKFKLSATSSPLTCKDYDPPTGCAYGVRRKIGLSRLFGKLPVPNCYALGHSALVPGVLGTMMASFLLFRQNIGEKCYRRLIAGKLR
ncbi:MAG: NAD(P)-binding protein [Lentisphaerae bacterium]|nr:NAD(P)-binding protein [Lentisphaerota bacterium]